MLLLFFLATPFLAGIGANFIYPMDVDTGGAGSGAVSGTGDVAVEQVEQDAQDRRQEIRDQRENFVNQVSRFSASTSFQNFASTMLGTEYDGESGLRPTVWEDLQASLGYLIFLLSETMLVFTAAYATFMRQDL